MSRVINTRNNSVLVDDLEWAKSMRQRLIGLMGRPMLALGRGLWIKRSGNSIHTFFMKFPIDLVFINRDGVVRHIVKDMRPWKVAVAPVLQPTDCLELPAGTVEKCETKIGDTVRVEN